MGSNEAFEAQKAADSTKEGQANNLGAYGMERSAAPDRDNQQKTDKLVDAGVLPSFDIMDSSAGFRTGKEMGRKDLQDAGIKCRKETNDDGSKATVADYPNGVKVSTSEGTTIEGPNGRKIEITGSSLIEVSPPNKIKPNGDVVDEKGREIAKRNEDGSVTVDTGKGFYTQHSDGTIRKETAIRSRDGKSFEVIDTDTPLGNLRPGDVVAPSHR